VLEAKKIISFFLAAIILALLSNHSCSADDTTTATTSAWLSFRGNPEHTGKTDSIGPPEEIEMKWRWRVYYESSPISASPAISADSTLYIATEGGYLGAISLSGGNSWIYNVSEPVTASPAVDSSGNMLAVTKDGYLYYLNARGELQWKCDFGVGIASSPVISGSTAYMGTDSSDVIAITLTPDNMTGTEDQSKRIYKWDILQWSFPAKGSVKSSPAFAGNTIYFGAGNYVYALSSNAGGTDNASSKIKWTYDVHNQITASPAVYNGAVYIGADDGYLYALKENVSAALKQGELLWKRKTNGSIKSSAAIDTTSSGAAATEAMIYVGSDDGRLYAIDENGEQQWTFSTLGPIHSSPVVDGNGDIYFGSDDGAIYALFPDGSLKWKFETGGKVRSSPVIGPDKTLYVGSDDGFLYCIGESTEENREFDMKIDVSLSLSSIENSGNPTTVSATVTSDSDGKNVLSRVASVTIDLGLLNLIGVLSSSDPLTGNLETGSIGKEIMLDDGLFEDDVAGDGVFTYAFGLTDDPSFLGWYEGIYIHYPALGTLGVGPVPLMVTVTDLYGNRTSKPFALKIDQKMRGMPPFQDTVTSQLNNQTLNISFTSGTPSILSIVPSQGSPGQRISVAILGKNTNFTKNRTRVEIFNDDGARIAYALPEKDDVDVLSDISLNANLNIVNTDQVTSGSLVGRWNVTVTTEFPEGGDEVVVGEDLFVISGTTAKTGMLPGSQFSFYPAQQTICEFTLDITNENGARPKGAPWQINTGYARDITIESAQSGLWTFDVALSACASTPSCKIITTASNFGYLTGEVRDSISGAGIDNATITALTGDSLGTPANSTVSSGGGYYLLPLSAAEQNYTVTVTKEGHIDFQREISIQDGEETKLNFSLTPQFGCPISTLAAADSLRPFYRFRDQVLTRSPAGRRWIRLYYRYAPEIVGILANAPEVREQCRNLVMRAEPALRNFYQDGTLKNDLLQDFLRIMDALSLRAGLGLRQTITAERDHLFRFMKRLKQTRY